MWISREAAFSDVVLAPAGVVVGAGVVGLLRLVPGWPDGLVGTIVTVVLAIVVMIGWPTWLARQRGETSATPAPLDAGDVGRSALLGLPIVAAGILSSLAAGLPLDRAAFGRLAVIPVSPEGIAQMTLLVVAALGSFLLVVLVARRAAHAFRSPDMSVTAGLRTYGMGFAAAAAVLQLLFSLAYDQPFSRGLAVGVALAVTVLLADRLVPPGLAATRAAILTPAIVAAALWIVQGGFLLGGPLLPRLAGAATAGTLALCMGAAVQAGRTWATALVPLAATIWLQTIIPVFG
ncbi:hypothetical protein [Salsipaludibacter albus]|uniref:hypothetical protein n=1 Tax=Salsipaludibacter albus TaxID=2849650 RepID=UPI001EE457C8|nr:hypothetical protein [Salsipaludibacter albus]MBY5163735.1 hypothetical protein [Salsipaludibacter albus]